jgi:hypothetical protein
MRGFRLLTITVLPVSIFLISLAGSASSASNDAKKPTAAVADFQSSNAPGAEASALSDMVRSAMFKSGKFVMVDKKNMDAILAEQVFQQTGCTDQECAVKLGRILNVQKMVVGSYTILGKVRYLNGQMIDVETGRIEGSTTEKDFELNEADKVTESLVAKLSGVVQQKGDLYVRQSGSTYEKTWFGFGLGAALMHVKVKNEATYERAFTGETASGSVDMPTRAVMPVALMTMRFPVTASGQFGVGINTDIGVAPATGTAVTREVVSSTGDKHVISVKPGMHMSFGLGGIGYVHTRSANIFGGLRLFALKVGRGDASITDKDGIVSKIPVKKTPTNSGVQLVAGGEYLINNALSLELQLQRLLFGNGAEGEGGEDYPGASVSMKQVAENSEEPWVQVALKYNFN